VSSEPRARLSAERQHAAEVLVRQFRQPGRVEHWLATGHPELSAAQRRRSWALVYGVLRNKTLLELQISPYLKKPFDKQCLEVRVALLLCCFELHCMDGVPDRAAVHQAVELVRALGQEPRTGFVNAVSRRLSRRELSPELPDRAAKPRQWAEQVASHPAWLVDEMALRLGDEEAARWCESNNQQPPVFVRLRQPVADDLAEAMTQLDLQPEPLVPGAMRLGPDHGRVSELVGFCEGGFWVQDAGAQAVGLLLGLQPGMRVLDACAAPGGKTIAAAQAVGPGGSVVAVDRSKNRLTLLHESLQRLGLDNVQVQPRDLLREPWGEREGDHPFDAVLLDAPCSAVGVIRRHPDVRWSRQPESLVQYGKTQAALLRAVAPAVAPNAALVYSVCSFTQLETDAVVADFLATDERFRTADPRAVLPSVAHDLLDGDVMRTYPHRHDMDAFFAVRLEAVQ
jgi:16S rRNA (cytosine967-C5)-methyltransferase